MMKSVVISKRLEDGSTVYELYVYTREGKFIFEADCETAAERLQSMFKEQRITEISFEGDLL